MSTLSKSDFINFFKYYKGEAHQEAGVGILYDQMRDVLKHDDHRWITTYRTPVQAPTSNPLDVPWQSQNDNASGTGYRECFSSSCAMVAMYYGKVKNDDEYNSIRQKYGDSTDAQAQVRALNSLGLQATFRTNGNAADLKAAIDAGRPVPCGWLHHGSVHAPSGGGHYSVVVGYDSDSFIINDPNGEANLTAGGYTSNMNGDHLSYSYKNWLPRWEVDGAGTGWYLDIRDPNAKK